MPRFAALAVSPMWWFWIQNTKVQRNGHRKGASKRLETATLNDPICAGALSSRILSKIFVFLSVLQRATVTLHVVYCCRSKVEVPNTRTISLLIMPVNCIYRCQWKPDEILRSSYRVQEINLSESTRWQKTYEIQTTRWSDQLGCRPVPVERKKLERASRSTDTSIS